MAGTTSWDASRARLTLVNILPTWSAAPAEACRDPLLWQAGGGCLLECLKAVEPLGSLCLCVVLPRPSLPHHGRSGDRPMEGGKWLYWPAAATCCPSL